MVCVGKAPGVDVEGGIVSVTVDKGCPGEDHVLVVVQEVGSDKPRPLSSYTVHELMELTRDYAARQRPTRQATQTAVYIAANITGMPSTTCSHSVVHSGLLLQIPIFPSNWGTVKIMGATLITPWTLALNTLLVYCQYQEIWMSQLCLLTPNSVSPQSIVQYVITLPTFSCSDAR